MCVMWYILINTVIVIYSIIHILTKLVYLIIINLNLINKQMPVSLYRLELLQAVRAFLFYDFEVLKWKKLMEI